MRARARALLALAVSAALGAALSCNTFDLPNETCDPSKQHGGQLSEPLSESACNRCLEDSCCDVVGVCERKNGCTEIVSGVHACVLHEGLGGARAETTCAKPLDDMKEADDAYRCMRDQCGGPCGLPVCRVDQAALLIHSAECDGCFASSCCPELNACYGSRACKLTVECIVKECGSSFGSTLVADALVGAPLTAPADAGDLASVCPDGGAPPSGLLGVQECVRKCLCEFKDNDQGLPPKDPAQRSIFLALQVYRCGVQADCGSLCTDGTDGGGDATRNGDAP
ncbi:MAG: hypothetical protein JWP87_3030 [Labilithrix sp.]|nr:hypothetical protein [Labilithrix sp.]